MPERKQLSSVPPASTDSAMLYGVTGETLRISQIGLSMIQSKLDLAMQEINQVFNRNGVVPVVDNPNKTPARMRALEAARSKLQKVQASSAYKAKQRRAIKLRWKQARAAGLNHI